MLGQVKLHVIASLEQHMGYRVHVNLSVSKDNHVPLEPIHIFWEKLHIEEHDVTHEDSGAQLDLEAE